ncbi:MAG: hypothetical protein ACOVVK_02495 [Elsteraceae bacterium]
MSLKSRVGPLHLFKKFGFIALKIPPCRQLRGGELLQRQTDLRRFVMRVSRNGVADRSLERFSHVSTKRRQSLFKDLTARFFHRDHLFENIGVGRYLNGDLSVLRLDVRSGGLSL